MAHMREKKNVYKVLVEKPEGKIPAARSTLRLEPTIKVALERNGWDGMDSVNSETCTRLF